MTRECHVRFCEGLAVRLRQSTHPWLPGPAKGVYYYLYLILDLYSRKIVGWEIHEEESSELAVHLLRRAYL